MQVLGAALYAAPLIGGVSTNQYFDGSVNRYLATGAASRYQQDANGHAWFTAPSGTAGNAITFTQAMTLTAAGNLSIGTTTPLVFNTGGSASARLLTVYNTATDAAGRGEIQIGNAATTSGQITGNLLFGCGASTTTANTVGSIYSELTASSTSTATGALVFATSNAGTQTEKMRLDSSGNLGLGVVPSAWDSGWKALQVTAGASIASNGSNSLLIHQNSYLSTGEVSRYLTSGSAASVYQQAAGQHAWYNAPSGTAGNAITFTQAMTLDANSKLSIGTTTPNGWLTVRASGAGSSSSGALASFDISGARMFGVNQNVSGSTYWGDLYCQHEDATVVTTPIYFNARFGATIAPVVGSVEIGLQATAPTLTVNSRMSFELTSNTSLKIVVRGTDGVTRSASLTLA
jgi:hypothetical protein